jgi:uncharacterized membrane protein
VSVGRILGLVSIPLVGITIWGLMRQIRKPMPFRPWAAWLGIVMAPLILVINFFILRQADPGLIGPSLLVAGLGFGIAWGRATKVRAEGTRVVAQRSVAHLAFWGASFAATQLLATFTEARYVAGGLLVMFFSTGTTVGTNLNLLIRQRRVRRKAADAPAPIPVPVPVVVGASAGVATASEGTVLFDLPRTGAPLDSLPAGTQLEVLDEIEGWAQVRVAGDRIGWVTRRMVDAPPASAPTPPPPDQPGKDPTVAGRSMGIVGAAIVGTSSLLAWTAPPFADELTAWDISAGFLVGATSTNVDFSLAWVLIGLTVLGVFATVSSHGPGWRRIVALLTVAVIGLFAYQVYDLVNLSFMDTAEVIDEWASTIGAAPGFAFAGAIVMALKR